MFGGSTRKRQIETLLFDWIYYLGNLVKTILPIPVNQAKLKRGVEGLEWKLIICGTLDAGYVIESYISRP